MVHHILSNVSVVVSSYFSFMSLSHIICFQNHIHFLILLILVTLFRFVGVGEASFVSLAAPFIDDNAPQAQVASSGMYMFTASIVLL